MIELPPLFVVDDFGARLKNAADCLRELNDSKTVLSGGLHPLLVDTPENYVQARKLLSEAAGKGIVLLDLAFRSQGERLWPAVADSLRALSDRTGLNFSESDGQFQEILRLQANERDKFIIEGVRVDGLSLVETLIANDRFSPCLVVICSIQGGLGDLRPFLEVFNKVAREAGRRLVFIKELDGRSLESPANARGILRDLEKCWLAHFPEFSLESLIDSTIREWLGYFRSLEQEDDFCWHDHIDNNVEAYAEILAKGLGCNVNSFTSNGLKAIFMLIKYSLSSSGESWPSSAFTKGNSTHEGFWGSAKPIRQDMLRSIMQRVSGLELEMVDEHAMPPLIPGLPFFLSLCDLFRILRKDDVLDVDASVRIVSRDYGTRLTVPLKQVVGKEFGLAQTWIRKIQKGNGELGSGVCGQLWNVMRARVEILSTQATRGNSEKRLLQLFEGQKRPVVGVHFAPHFLHFYWN